MAARGPKSDKLWSDAVRLAALRMDDDGTGQKRKRLSIIADNLCRAAMAGDIQAIKEVGDRIDGKPQQAVVGSGENGEHMHKVLVEYVAANNS
jgi:hypothetical protein